MKKKDKTGDEILDEFMSDNQVVSISGRSALLRHKMYQEENPKKKYKVGDFIRVKVDDEHPWLEIIDVLKGNQYNTVANTAIATRRLDEEMIVKGNQVCEFVSKDWDNKKTTDEVLEFSKRLTKYVENN